MLKTCFRVTAAITALAFSSANAQYVDITHTDKQTTLSTLYHAKNNIVISADSLNRYGIGYGGKYEDFTLAAGIKSDFEQYESHFIYIEFAPEKMRATFDLSSVKNSVSLGINYKLSDSFGVRFGLTDNTFEIGLRKWIQ